MLLKIFLIINLLIINSKSLPLNKLSDSEETDQKYDVKLFQTVLEEIFDKYIEPKGAQPSEYSKYFDQIENEDNSEKMLGDTPNSETVLIADNENLKNLVASLNKNNSNVYNFTADRENPSDTESIKKQWLLTIQQRILERVGRRNNVTSVPPSITEPVVWILNRTGSVPAVPKTNEPEFDGDDFVNKKIRSFYPSCDIPRNTDEDVWKETNTMNLFFNVDYSGAPTGATEQGQEDTVNIASATLRIYRVPPENSTENAHSMSDEDKQIRVSVYWYSRSLKKHKAVKRRLADSRMVSIVTNTSYPKQFVEFNIRPAAKTWIRGRNLGLGIVVEDVDGNQLNPGEFFKGSQCDTVGNVSTPIPIPTTFLDSLANRTLHTPYDTLMPKLDICTIELTQNFSGPSFGDTSKIVCRMSTPTEEVQKPVQRDFADSGRHIRHHHTPDFRDKFINKRIVMVNSQLNNLNSQMQQNFSGVNR